MLCVRRWQGGAHRDRAPDHDDHGDADHNYGGGAPHHHRSGGDDDTGVNPTVNLEAEDKTVEMAEDKTVEMAEDNTVEMPKRGKAR